MRQPAATAFIVEDLPGTTNSSTYSFWHSGYAIQSSVSLPSGFPHESSYDHAQDTTRYSQAPQSTASSDQVPKDALSSVDYVATPCPDCGQVIKVSSATTYHMDKHRESQRCKRASARRKMKEEEMRARTLRTELFRTSPGQSASAGRCVDDQGDASVGSMANTDANATMGGFGEAASNIASADKGKARETLYSHGPCAEKRYRDAGVQADPVLPQHAILEVRSTRETNRRCHSEPPTSPATQSQGEFIDPCYYASSGLTGLTS